MNPVAIVDEDDEGLFVEILYGEDGSSLKRGDYLYASRDQEVAKLGALIWNETSIISAELNRAKELLKIIGDGVKHKGWSIGTDVFCKIEELMK